ncbi:MAG TPA: GH116 family glycosyl-hydrolase [Candidatus Paceibacterota bacterium]|jgi:non-lysosomal glucosylceramidase|nr:GH116 family glycosyl-hydrolase [Candidatus Paceibacterota bacterium]
MSRDGHAKCAGAKCGCPSSAASTGWGRRQFLQWLGLGGGLLALQPWGAMAGPFSRTDFRKLVPEDKKLSPEWLRSLTARGERAVYRGPALEKIGMPAGGICAGQLYLGGDGRLWNWDIFNQPIRTDATHYARPMEVHSPVDQGFALRVACSGRTTERRLDRTQWREVAFIGEYPIGQVEFRDPDWPVSARLEAFSPFIPLNTDDSSLPATLLEFTVENHAAETVEVELAGWLENAVCLQSAQTRDGFRRNRLVRSKGLLSLECSAEEAPEPPAAGRPDIVFDDFESASYGHWTATGTAFGSGPVAISDVPSYQGNLGGNGRRVVNSHASAPGQNVGQKDAATGTLTSRPFLIERHYLNFLIGGGAHAGRTCMNLLIEGKVALSATGRNNNRMEPVSWDLRRWAGQQATLQIVDHESGPWGNVGVDNLVFSDRPSRPPGPLAEAADFGTLCLSLTDPQPHDAAATDLPAGTFPDKALLDSAGRMAPSRKPFGQKLVGALSRKLRLRPGASAKVTFLLTWYMPNLRMERLPPGRYYAARFDSALAVAQYIRANLNRLAGQTRLWHDTWYDATLPYWFLDRTFLNASILASSTCHRFHNGRFYGWEGVGCCPGTCAHVWHYAQAVARLFPDLERMTREQVDFGLALQPDGAIHFRGEFNNLPAVDGQAGTILRALREHQMSPDAAFLKRNWPGIRKATEWLIARDADGDGLIEGSQHNTLDTDWHGPVAWLSGLYVAALRAAEQMGREAGDFAFAATCGRIAEAGSRNIVARLFEEEYFVNRPDPRHPEAINSGTGCHIDQVMGQGWAFQVGLPRVLPEKETRLALQSLWRYNFTPDVGPYRKAYPAGRWYAMPGEAGLLMCTFPRADWDYAQAKGKGPDWAAGYFNECMNGFEYQVAAHCLWEGMITEGLAITRAVHDRYHPLRRNPWNEVECGDHYARSMASYGVFLAACGFECHGPRGHLGFAPRLRTRSADGAARFQAAFTCATGWGTFSETWQPGRGDAAVRLKWGELRLRTLALEMPEGKRAASLRVACRGRRLSAEYSQTGSRLLITLERSFRLNAGQTLELRLRLA